MARFRKLFVLLCVVGFLLLLGVLRDMTREKRVAQREEDLGVAELSQGLTEAFVSKIVVYKGDDEKDRVILKKNRQGEWFLESRFGVKARRETVSNILQSLTDLKGEVRAASDSVFDDFDIDDAKGLHVILESDAGQVLKHYVISLKKPSWDETFVRLSDSQKVVMVRKDLLSALGLYFQSSGFYIRTPGLDQKHFADLRMPSFSLAEITRIEIRDANKEPLTLIRQEGPEKAAAIWRFAGPLSSQKVNAAKVDEFLRSVSNISFQEALDPLVATYGFERPALRIKLSTAGVEHLIQIEVGAYVESQKSYFIKISPQGHVFSVSSPLIQNLKKDKSFFRQL